MRSWTRGASSRVCSLEPKRTPHLYLIPWYVEVWELKLNFYPSAGGLNKQTKKLSQRQVPVGEELDDLLTVHTADQICPRCGKFGSTCARNAPEKTLF